MTLDYYNQNAEIFFEDTRAIDFSSIQSVFTEYLPENAYILDYGCGSGRDTAWFLSQGYRVDAIDGSAELCRLASQNTGIAVKQMMFQDLCEDEKYDGIWACASILHVPKKDLPDIFQKMTDAVKDSGVIYTSFKYGDHEGERRGRYFSDFTEDTLQELLKEIPELMTEKMWTTADRRPDREDEKWLNIILRKQTIH